MSPAPRPDNREKFFTLKNRDIRIREDMSKISAPIEPNFDRATQLQVSLLCGRDICWPRKGDCGCAFSTKRKSHAPCLCGKRGALEMNRYVRTGLSQGQKHLLCLPIGHQKFSSALTGWAGFCSGMKRLSMACRDIGTKQKAGEILKSVSGIWKTGVFSAKNSHTFPI